MRIFLPLTAMDLLAANVPDREGIPAPVSKDLTGDQMEAVYEDAMDQAAFRSLELLFENPSAAPCRIVGVFERAQDPSSISWDRFDSFHLDEPDTGELIERARSAQTQQELDDAVADIVDESLDWFDVSEYPALRQRFESR